MESVKDTPQADAMAETMAASRLAIIPEILKTICHTTGMGFAAVARVTPGRWIACGVQDNIQFGLRIGDELPVDTTICHEIRQSGEGVIIDEVNADEFYCKHHTPAMYGFQSYISIPVLRYDGSFFGTLCAIDPNPAMLHTPEIITMFKVYSELISLHLNAQEQLPEDKVLQLEQRSVAVLQTQLADLMALLTPEVLKNKKGEAYNNALHQMAGKVRTLLADLRA